MAYLPGRKRLGPRRLFHGALTCPNRRKSSPRRAKAEAERLKDAWEAMMAAPPVLNPFQIIFQEHAKYMVAIKDLQSQVQVLQQFRTRVLQAFPQLDSSAPYGAMPSKAPAGTLTTLPSTRRPGVLSKTGRILPTVQKAAPATVSRHAASKPQAYAGHAGSGPGRVRDSKKFVVVAQGKNWMRIRPCAKKSDSELDESDDASSDSVHSMEPPDKRKTKGKRKGEGAGPRQDSGFSTDGKERHHQDRSSDGRWLKMSSAAEDELMNVLELIGQKSEVLRTKVDRAELTPPQGPTLGDIGLKLDDVLTEVERLHAEKEQILERLVMAEAEREMYKGEMIRMRNLLIDSEASRKVLQEQLSARSPPTSRGGGPEPLTGKEEPDTPGRTLWASGAPGLPTKLRVHLDKARVSAILSETRTLELQRQLLEAMLRNEVLKTQLEQNAADRTTEVRTWRQAEEALRTEAEELRQTGSELQGSLRHAEAELREERSKRQVLERALQAAYKDLTSANSRQESVTPAENVRQLSVELFPVHQMVMNQPSGKFSERSSPMTWRPHASTSTSTIPTASLARTSAPVTSAATTDFHHPSKIHINGHQDSPPTVNGNDHSNKTDFTSPDAYRRSSRDLEDDDTLTNLYSRVRPSPTSRTSSNLSWRKAQEISTNKPERQSKPNSYLTEGHSPKSRTSNFGPKFSQSAEDLRPSEWDWAMSANQRLVNMTQRMPMSEAAT